jgi:DNA-binding LacI/PurR family transcriptional regulator
MNIDNVYSVCTDEVDAMEQIVHYLYDKGHQSMGLIGGVPSVSVAVDKMNYFRDLIVNKYPIDYQKSFTAFGGFNATSGYEAFMETFKNGELPSVIIGMNDEVAIGILRACFELGIQVPEQLSVFGYDNTFVSAMVYPSLSTFSHDYNQLAEKAVEVMIKLIEGDQSLEKEYLIKGELVMRESVK